eukprot:375305-Pelagomonas_calceolata.AAC.2
MQLVHNSPTPIYLYKVNSHAGVAGNEGAGAIAKHQAIQGDTMQCALKCPLAYNVSSVGREPNKSSILSRCEQCMWVLRRKRGSRSEFGGKE